MNGTVGYARPMPQHNLSVIDANQESRFELLLDDDRVGHADYSIDGDVVTVPHVETDPAHRGQGFAAELMAGVIADARENGRTIRPLCPYAERYMRDRPDTQDLVAR